MMHTPDKQQQIIQTHAGLILGVVQCVHNAELRPQLEQALTVSEKNGWDKLVAAIRKILDGSRDESVLNGLDDDDTVIVRSILHGLQDPNTLPKPEEKPDAAMAAPMLANLINEARRGDHNAVIMLGGMAEQMSMAGGDMAAIGAILKDLIDGERNVDKLCDKVGPQGESLIVQILAELGKLEVH
jgi:hypothetical protein